MASAATTRPRARTTRSAKPSVITAATPAEILAIADWVTSEVLVERVGQMRVVTLGAVAAKNNHQLGPPGTGKSLGLREFCKCITGGRLEATSGEELDAHFFEKTVHAQMPADALIGGYDMPRFARDGVFERNVEHYLPNADFAFIDEITRANGPTLDALLPLMNTTERAYEANGCMKRSPLRFLVTASNYMPDPDDAHLGAFVDRFTLMQYIDYVQADDSFIELLRRDQKRRTAERAGVDTRPTVSLQAFIAAQMEAQAVDVTRPEFLDAAAKLRRNAKAEGLRVSDRRWVELADVARAAAWLAGRDHCVPEDLAALESGLWREVTDRPLAHKLVLDFHNRFEREGAARRSEAEAHIEQLKILCPQVEGKPPSDPLDQETIRALTNAGRSLRVVNQRTEQMLSEAKQEQSDAPALRELHAELQSWREWLGEQGLPDKW